MTENHDYLVTVEAFDLDLGHKVTIKVGYAYKHRRGGGSRIFLNEDPRCKQLIYEAATLELIPVRQPRPK